MRKVSVVLAVGMLVCAHAEINGQGQGQGKGNKGNKDTAMVGWFGAGAVSSDGDFSGTLFDGQLDTSNPATLTLDCAQIEALPGSPAFPGCENAGFASGTLVGIGINAMQALAEGENPDCLNNEDVLCNGYARQAFITWTAGNQTYRLQYGDVNTQPDPGVPNYAHVECHEVVDGECRNATADGADSLPGYYDSTVEAGIVSRRVTGPTAKLLAGKGRLREIGLYRVPFSFEICGEGAACFPQ